MVEIRFTSQGRWPLGLTMAFAIDIARGRRGRLPPTSTMAYATDMNHSRERAYSCYGSFGRAPESL
jgi:hypothetical protein